MEEKERSCWGCIHMHTDENDEENQNDTAFYCLKLNRWFDKQSEDDACEDWRDV